MLVAAAALFMGLNFAGNRRRKRDVTDATSDDVRGLVFEKPWFIPAVVSAEKWDEGMNKLEQFIIKGTLLVFFPDFQEIC